MSELFYRNATHNAVQPFAVRSTSSGELTDLPDRDNALPSMFRVVRAVGKVVSTTLSDAYNPTAESGRRIAFDEALQAIDDAVLEELIASEYTRLD